MIHWGSSVPCTLYIDTHKRCDFSLPDDVTWYNFKQQVAEQFRITILAWYCTCKDRIFCEEISTVEEFQKVKSICLESGERLQLNCSTSQQPGPQPESPQIKLAVELAVQSYLELNGAQLLTTLAHQHKLCCCNNKEESVQDVELVEDIELSPDSGSSLARTRKTEDESSGPVDRKRAKVIEGDKEYFLACSDNSKVVMPGDKVTATWNLITKHAITSQWEVIEEGGSLLNVSEINWVQATDNIYTFSTEFLAPTQEGFYESIWSLHQDNRERERFAFCKVQVALNHALKGKSALASHGNIPAATSVAKHLNSNKVFCMQGDGEAESNQPSGSGYVVVPTLTSSTSSDSSSIEIIGSSNDMGFFLPSEGNEDRTISSPPDSTGFMQHSLEGSFTNDNFESSTGFNQQNLEASSANLGESFAHNIEGSYTDAPGPSHQVTLPNQEVKILNNAPYIPSQIPVSPSPWDIPSENKQTNASPGNLNIHSNQALNSMCDNVQQLNIEDESVSASAGLTTHSSQSSPSTMSQSGALSPADMFRSELLAALGSGHSSTSSEQSQTPQNSGKSPSPTGNNSRPSNKQSAQIPRRPKSQSGEVSTRINNTMTQSATSALSQSGANNSSQSWLSVSDPDMTQKLRLLREMGFKDDGANERLLLEKSVEDVALYLSARTDE